MIHTNDTWVLFVAASGLLACAAGPDADPRGAKVEVSVAPYTLPGLANACYRLTVSSAEDEIVWQQANVCADRYGDNVGSIAYVGPCDAQLVEGAPQWNTITLELEELFDADGVIDRASYQNPCGHADNGNDDGFGACTRSFECFENRDVPVAFNLTVMRRANQGFFDIAVNFEDIFCSAKLDTGMLAADGEISECRPYDLLHNPDRGGARDATHVLAVACTLGDDDPRDIELFIDDIVISCPDQVIVVAPCAGEGNRRTGDDWSGVLTDAAGGSEAIAERVFQVLGAWGVSAYAGHAVRYWSAAIGAADLAGCALTTRLSVDSLAEPVAIGKTEPRTIDADRIYPLIEMNVSDLGVCAQYPLSSAVAGVATQGVSTRYTDDQVLHFAHQCSAPVDEPPEPSCEDGVRNGAETDSDCGGSCPPCDDGARCVDDVDCESEHCPDLLCRPATCFDGQRNQDETDVDCGGGCPPCDDGLGCALAADCRSGLCGPGGTCEGASCGDGIQNGAETGVDCGGSCPSCEWSLVSVGVLHTCGLRGGGLYCWGRNQGPEVINRVGADSDWSVVSAGEDFGCGLRGGALYCWGANERGQLGDGYVTSRGNPVQVGAASDWNRVSAGLFHACGIRDGALYCWGDNFFGQLGDGTTLRRLSPVRIGETNDWSEISAGHVHTCGLRGGTLYCWGANDLGELGDGTTTQRKSPVQIGAATDWSDIDASGARHTCGVRSGQAYCWGINQSGQLGIGSTVTHRTSPVRVGSDDDWSEITTGSSHTCGRRSGVVYCWGRNLDGQLGDGTTTNRSAPVQVGTATDWDEVDAGSNSTCGRRGPALYCWGNNQYGKLGDGTTVTRTTPVAVQD